MSSIKQKSSCKKNILKSMKDNRHLVRQDDAESSAKASDFIR